MDLEKLENSDEDKIYRMRANASEPRDYAGENVTTFLTDMTNNLILGDINSRNALSIGTILKHKEFESDYNHSSQYSFASSITQRNINTDTLRRSLKMMLPV